MRSLGGSGRRRRAMCGSGKIVDEREARACLLSERSVGRDPERVGAEASASTAGGCTPGSVNLSSEPGSASRKGPRLVELVCAARSLIVRAGTWWTSARAPGGGRRRRRRRCGGCSRFLGRAEPLPGRRVFVVVAPLDMRGSFDSLAGAVRRLGLDPVDGHLYLFLNKRQAPGQGAVVRRLWLVRARKTPRGGQLPAPRARRRQPLRCPSTARRSPRSWPASTSPPPGADGSGDLHSKKS